MTGKRIKETFRDDVLCLDCSDDYTDVHICQNSSDHTLKVGAIYRMKLYRNIFEIKKERNSTHFSSIDCKGKKVKQKKRENNLHIPQESFEFHFCVFVCK